MVSYRLLMNIFKYYLNMKKTLFFIICISFFDCTSNEISNEAEAPFEHSETPVKVLLPQFKTVKEMC